MTGTCLFPHRPVFPGPISRLSYKKERPYLPGRTEVARTAEKVPFPDIERRRNPLDYGETLPSRRPSGPSQYHPAKSGHGIYGAQGRYASDPAEAVSSAAAAHRSPSFSASLQRMLPLFKEYNLKEPILKQRVMRSRWGSCMPLKGIVTMNTYLAIMPEAIIDHVMLHELCHFIHPNHSRHFMTS